MVKCSHSSGRGRMTKSRNRHINFVLVQKYCFLDNIVCALWRHQADIWACIVDCLIMFLYHIDLYYYYLFNVLPLSSEIKLCVINPADYIAWKEATSNGIRRWCDDVVAMTESRLWVLDRQVFQAIMMTTGIRRQEETMKFLRRWNSRWSTDNRRTRF